MPSTSKREAVSEPSPRQPHDDPMRDAIEAQLEIDDLIHDIDVQIAMIRKLMVHRFVRLRRTRVVFRVLEVRIAYGKAVLYGHGRGKRGKTQIGPLADVDIIDTGFAP